MSKPSLSVVVPVYNSADGLADLLSRLDPVLAVLGRPAEVILVNDGSRDGSWDAITALIGRYDFVRGIDLARNYGQQNALLAGIRAARHDVVVTIDDDLQNPPEEIPRLLAALDGPFDVVYGKPARQQHGLWRDLASWLTKALLSGVVGTRDVSALSAFRAFRTRLREAFATFNGPHVSIDVLLTWGTTRFTAVVVDHHPRARGQSNYDFRRLVRQAITLFTDFSPVPLRFASYLGFACSGLGALALAWVLGAYLAWGTAVPGFAFLASLVALSSGTQMCLLGVLGEYLARVHFRLLDKPPYVIHTSRDGGWRAAG